MSIYIDVVVYVFPIQTVLYLSSLPEMDGENNTSGAEDEHPMSNVNEQPLRAERDAAPATPMVTEDVVVGATHSNEILPPPPPAPVLTREEVRHTSSRVTL